MVGPVEAALDEADGGMLASWSRVGAKGIEGEETKEEYGDDYDTPLSSIGHVVMSRRVVGY